MKTCLAGRSIFAWLDPGDVVTDGGHFPTFKSLRWNHHGEVGFAARRREGGRDVVFLSLWRGNAEYEHVLCKPALIPSHGRGNAQGKTFFT